jgi:hypothetical protein
MEKRKLTTKFNNILEHASGTEMGLFDEKIQRARIS